MYEGQSFSRRYSDYCEQRKRRRRRTRRLVLAAFLVVCGSAGTGAVRQDSAD